MLPSDVTTKPYFQYKAVLPLIPPAARNDTCQKYQAELQAWLMLLLDMVGLQVQLQGLFWKAMEGHGMKWMAMEGHERQ